MGASINYFADRERIIYLSVGLNNTPSREVVWYKTAATPENDYNISVKSVSSHVDTYNSIP